MAKIFENSQLVNKLADDDPECLYVNSRMEMSAEFLRNLHRNGECYDTMHGVVPTYKLPPGYSYGNFNFNTKDKIVYEKNDNKNNNVNSQNSSNSNSTLRMESDEPDNDQADETKKMIETVRGDLILSDDEEEHDKDMTSTKTNDNGFTDNSEKLLFDTLNACSQRIPNMNSLSIFQKHYKGMKNNSSQKISPMKVLPDNISVEAKDLEDANEQYSQKEMMKLIDLISASTYKKSLSSSFQNICNTVNDNKRKASLKDEEKSLTPPKLLKMSKDQEKKNIDIPDTQYRFFSTNNVCELFFHVVPEEIKDFKFDNLMTRYKKSIDVPKEVATPIICSKPKYVTQDSLPFNSESISKKDNKVNENNASIVVPQTLSNNTAIENVQNPVKKPEAAAKQFYAQSTNYSSYNNNSKVAIVTGNVNKTQSIWPNKSDSSNKPTPLPSLQLNSQSSYQKPNPNQQSRSLAFKNTNDNDADESKVVEGLMAMNKMRTYFKNDFIARMRNLEIEKWLKEVRSLKEKAIRCKGELDYAPQIMVFIRKNLFYNYSLEVKSDYAKSHHTYLENAAIIKQSCSDITQIYNEHEKNIIDKNSIRLWNIKLVKYFTVIMCHRLSAILQYRAFKNVSDDCRKIHDMLVRSGVIDKNDRTNPLVTESHQHSSPFSVLSSYSPGQISNRNSSPRICNSGNQSTLLSSASHSSVTLTPEIKAKLQRYIDHTNIINASYSDWMLAEKHLVLYCNRSSRHEESWREFEWKIIEKTGGVVISSIDESVPFVIKYLEGYINFMNEFMKQSL